MSFKLGSLGKKLLPLGSDIRYTRRLLGLCECLWHCGIRTENAIIQSAKKTLLFFAPFLYLLLSSSLRGLPVGDGGR